MPQAAQSRSFHRLVVVVSDREGAGQAASRALADLAGARSVDVPVPAADHPPNDAYREVIRRGARFLDLVAPTNIFTLLTVDSLAAVPEAASRAAATTGSRQAVLTLLVIDHRAHRYRALWPEDLNEDLTKLALSLGDSAEFEPGPGTVQVYTVPERRHVLLRRAFHPAVDARRGVGGHGRYRLLVC